MKSLIFVSILLFSSLGFSKTISIEAQFALNGEYIEIDDHRAEADGWELQIQDDEPSYRLNKTIDESELPYSIGLSDSYLTISKDGTISMGASIGDSDASADGTLTWPTDANGLLPLGAPLTLNVSGGDHASGSWQFDGTTKISVQN